MQKLALHSTAVWKVGTCLVKIPGVLSNCAQLLENLSENFKQLPVMGEQQLYRGKYLPKVNVLQVYVPQNIQEFSVHIQGVSQKLFTFD